MASTCPALILTVLLSATAAGQPADAKPAGLSLSIDTHRPLAALADALQKRYSIIVTYEDSLWLNPSDLEELKLASPPAHPVSVPRKAAVSFHYPAPEDGGTVAVIDVLSSFLDQYHAAGAPGRFRVEGGEGIYHLIPAGGNPVLDTPIHLVDEERTVDDTLDAIMAQLNESSPVGICWGFVPLNLFNQTRIRMSADGEPARQVMRRILKQLRRHTTWRLNYDPVMGRYVLNFLLLPDVRGGVPEE